MKVDADQIIFGSAFQLEDSSKISRIRHLQEFPAGVRFLSNEPLIGRMGRLNLTGIDLIFPRKNGPG
jgi:protein gp37